MVGTLYGNHQGTIHMNQPPLTTVTPTSLHSYCKLVIVGHCAHGCTVLYIDATQTPYDATQTLAVVPHSMSCSDSLCTHVCRGRSIQSSCAVGEVCLAKRASMSFSRGWVWPTTTREWRGGPSSTSNMADRSQCTMTWSSAPNLAMATQGVDGVRATG